jgi:hypothetical protein
MDTQYLSKLENSFNMKKLISEDLIQIITEKEGSFLNDELISIYEDAMKDFEDLIEKGFTKKRENNLLGINDSHLHRITLGTFKNSLANDLSKIEVLKSLNSRTKTNFSSF